MPDPPNPKLHLHPARTGKTGAPTGAAQPRDPGAAYAELAVTSNFTFLTGASHPDEFVMRAAELGYRAIAIADRNTLAGVVRAHVAAKAAGIPLAVGARLCFVAPATLSLLVFPVNRRGYGALCQLLTRGKRRTIKGCCELALDEVLENNADWLAVALPAPALPSAALDDLRRLRAAFDEDRLSLALTCLYESTDAERQDTLAAWSRATAIPLVAVNDVYYHVPARRPLQDVLTCIRHGCTLTEAGYRLFPNGERYLKEPAEIARLFSRWPEAVARSVAIAERAAQFRLDELRYEYPHEICPPACSPTEYLAALTWQGAQERFPAGVPDKVAALLQHELRLIAELRYEPYFLTVRDIVRFAREREILCQGRGAAANSAVCYCLGVTAVDPTRVDMLFERFVSHERGEPPDIDIDFEHERREEVIQYLYAKYGRERAGLTAEVISYRGRSAIRDVGKALGLSLDAVDRLAKRIDHWDDGQLQEPGAASTLAKLGFDPRDLTMHQLFALTRELVGFPRHLSQHVGGFVITRGPLSELVPIENAAMADRTVIEWDKDDIEALGMLKVDVLALGMLTCIRKCFELIERHHGRPLTLATIPAEDPVVYDMICNADTVGVFQIESRAQMTMLPRLRPRCYYDLVIEVAIVRPGPIQGGMVHPYLRRRNGEEETTYPKDEIRAVLKKTLGVPLFQEQAMRLAVVAAGFTPGEADQLRRAMAAWRHSGQIEQFQIRFMRGMLGNGYTPEFAEAVFNQIRGFGDYGFPESHAASFALLVYVSAWLKCYYPAAFAAALLNSQPVGFYAPAQIVRDAQDHGVVARPIDVNHSDWDCTLEDAGRTLRLGLRQIGGLREADAQTLVAARSRYGSAPSPFSLWRRTQLSVQTLRRLAHADAFRSLGLDRQQALWSIRALRDEPLPLFDGVATPLDSRTVASPAPTADRSHGAVHELEFATDPSSAPQPALPTPSPLSQVVGDYRHTGLSLKAHPVAFLRESLQKQHVLTAAEFKLLTPGRYAAVAGMVLFRQRPGTASGVLFMTLEDETGRADLIVRPHIYERYKAVARHGQFVLARGRVERQATVVHMLVSRLVEISAQLATVPFRSRDFR